MAISAIHMDAYKKLVLVQLLADGKTSPVPQYTPQAITRSFKQLAQPYASFSSAYERSDALSADEVFRIADEKRDAFEKVGLSSYALAPRTACSPPCVFILGSKRRASKKVFGASQAAQNSTACQGVQRTFAQRHRGEDRRSRCRCGPERIF